MKFNPASLREARKKAGLTMDELAKKSKVSVSNVYYLETGRIPSPRTGTLSKLAEALGIEWSIFFVDDSQIFDKASA